MIIARSGRDFDNMVGPMVVSCALAVSLMLNFVFQVTSGSRPLSGSRFLLPSTALQDLAVDLDRDYFSSAEGGSKNRNVFKKRLQRLFWRYQGLAHGDVGAI